MSGDSEFTRREFVTGAISTAAVATVGASVLVARSGQAIAASSTSSSIPSATASRAAQLLVFDPEHADACRRVEGGVGAGCATLPVTGDRVRFGRDLFGSGNAPDVVAGLTHYADYILLSGCAAEHGYRANSVQVQTHLVEWTVVKARRAISS